MSDFKVENFSVTPSHKANGVTYNQRHLVEKFPQYVATNFSLESMGEEKFMEVMRILGRYEVREAMEIAIKNKTATAAELALVERFLA